MVKKVNLSVVAVQVVAVVEALAPHIKLLAIHFLSGLQHGQIIHINFVSSLPRFLVCWNSTRNMLKNSQIYKYTLCRTPMHFLILFEAHHISIPHEWNDHEESIWVKPQLLLAVCVLFMQWQVMHFKPL